MFWGYDRGYMFRVGRVELEWCLGFYILVYFFCLGCGKERIDVMGCFVGF